MRLPWKKQESEEGVYFVRSKKPKETLAQTADKLIQRRMKKDPDGYGIAAAERIKGIHHEAPKTVKDFLRELKEYREIMSEAGLTEGGGGKSLLREIIEVLPALPQLLQEARQLQQSVPHQQSPVRQIAHQMQPKLQQPEPEPDREEVPLMPLISVISLTPEEAFGKLQSEPGWLAVLKSNTPDGIVEMVRPFTNHPEHGGQVQLLIDHLQSEEGKEWLQNIIELVKNN